MNHTVKTHIVLDVCFCNIFLFGGIFLSYILETPDLAFSYHLESVAITGVCLSCIMTVTRLPLSSILAHCYRCK